MRNKVVYIHRRKDNGVVFYVGAGGIRRAYTNYGRSARWNEVNNSSGFDVEIIKDGLTIEESFILEKEVIKKYGCEIDGGVLVNFSKGGLDGAKGRKLSAETKLNMSKAHKGNSYAKGNKNQARKVVDIVTKKIYLSVEEAALSIGIKRRTLSARLTGQNPNNTNLRYL